MDIFPRVDSVWKSNFVEVRVIGSTPGDPTTDQRATVQIECLKQLDPIAVAVGKQWSPSIADFYNGFTPVDPLNWGSLASDSLTLDNTDIYSVGEFEINKISVSFTPEHLKALSDYFTEPDGLMDGDLHSEIGIILLKYAAAAGLYNEELG